MRVYKVTSTSSVATGSGYIKGITLVAGAANASITLQDTTDGATASKDMGGVKAVANESENSDMYGMSFDTGIYATISGAGAVAYIYIE